MVGQAFLLGIWKNFDDIEENLTMEELQQILKSQAEKEERQFKAMAAINGIDLDEDEEAVTFEEVERRAKAKLAGKDESTYTFEEWGFEVEVEEY